MYTIISYPRNKLCNIGIMVGACWAFGSMVAVGGGKLEDEGMSSTLALFLVNRKIKAA